MSRKWLSYLGAHTVFNIGADTEVAALHHQVSFAYAQRESDKLHEAERKNILERIEQADREQRERRAAARRQSIIATARRQSVLAAPEYQYILRSSNLALLTASQYLRWSKLV
jgi:hypothetical protein